ncbi:MAG TPA: DUF488 family protein [Nitrososphaeraceae archaeon]|nr:DUF488 family protein [Nitrososphaeraceae archaeon]
MIKAKRVYDKQEADDGFRVLVDRVWPRGLKKNNIKIDLWQKDIAPSTSLRKWFNHDQRKWNEFKSRYYGELNNKQEIIRILLEKAENGIITLLYSSKEENYNNAIALKEFLDLKL